MHQRRLFTTLILISRSSAFHSSLRRWMSSSSSSSSSASSDRSASSFHPSHRIAKFSAPTVWHEFTPLANQSKATNLGQGFPGWSPPAFVSAAAASSALETAAGTDFMVNQYARSQGHLPLVQRLAARASAQFHRDVNALTEVCVFNGATEALAASMLGLLNEGDEIVVFEPAFDIYIAIAEMAGAKIKPVPLKPTVAASSSASWTLDWKEFEAAFTPKTRLFLFNSPQNPTGKMFDSSELQRICEVVKRFPQVVTVADEVYEEIVFSGRQHKRIANEPGMWERTISVSSAGKTFSITGWKVGWAVGPEHLVRSAAIAHQWLAFSVATPLQHAVALSLDQAQQPYQGFNSYYDWLRAEYDRKRKILSDGLESAGIIPIQPEGGFFIVGDTSRVQLPEPYASDSSVTRDWSLCRWLTKEIGVAAIPPSAFYGEATKGQAANFARFAFCKPDDVLQEACKRLLKVKDFIKQ